MIKGLFFCDVGTEQFAMVLEIQAMQQQLPPSTLKASAGYC